MTDNLTGYVDGQGTPIKYGDIISFAGDEEVGVVVKPPHSCPHQEPRYMLFWPESEEYGQHWFYLEDWENDPVKKDIDHLIIGSIYRGIK